MCAHSIEQKKKLHFNAFFYGLMILLGLISGFLDIGPLHTLGTFISDTFIKIFRCISLPIIALSIIVTLSSYHSKKSTEKIWKKTILYTLTTTIVASTLSCALYLLINPENVSSLSKVQTSSQMLGQKTNYLNYLKELIPSNIFSPFLEHQVMGVLLVGIVIGLAIRAIPDQASKQTITQFFQGAHGIFLTVTRWVVAIIPIGLYGFITVTVIQLREGIALQGIGEYLSVVVLANIVQGFIILPLWLRFNGIKPFDMMQKMMPALSLAFFSKSSAGTLPVTMETAEKYLKVDPQVSRFVLPLCTSINMNGCAAFIFATVIYVMQNHGLEVTLSSMALWIIVSTIAAIGNAGVPMGCFFLSASLLASMDVPITLLGIILPFYAIIDMIETSLNVWSDSCVAKVVNEKVNFSDTLKEELQEAV